MAIIRRRLLLVSVLLIASIGATFAQAEKVYVTKTGSKYHRASCSSLSKSKIEMPLAEAAKHYGACKNCKPPIPPAVPATGAGGASAAKAPAVERAAPVESGRCQATTKKGTQCSRKAQSGRRFCWQH
jgi:hypothetical protein